MESNKYIIVKFSELHLKGGNKKEFVSVLMRNIRKKFEDYGIESEIKNFKDKLEIYSDQLDKVPNALREVVGISVFEHAISCEFNKENVEALIKEELSTFKKGTSFRVSAKIIDSNAFENKEAMIKWLAWLGTKELGLKIDLDNYEIDLNVRIEQNIVTIILNKETGVYGLPAGANGKALTLLSGGIDSPVAAYKTITRGINMNFITFLTPVTYEENTVNKITSLAKQINKYNGIDGKLFLVNFEKVQGRIMTLEDTSYRITLLRRYFMRFAELVSKKYGYKFVVTGDALGQVASQTPESMTQIDNATEQLIVRPLVSSSKNEIINIAHDIGTYEISIQPGDDMCSFFTPKNPIIFPKKYMVEKLESELEKMDEVLESVFNENMRVLDLKEI